MSSVTAPLQTGGDGQYLDTTESIAREENEPVELLRGDWRQSTSSRVDDRRPPTETTFRRRLCDNSKDVADVGLVRTASKTAARWTVGNGSSVERILHLDGRRKVDRNRPAVGSPDHFSSVLDGVVAVIEDGTGDGCSMTAV
jgi:hypothetical protein